MVVPGVRRRQPFPGTRQGSAVPSGRHRMVVGQLVGRDVGRDQVARLMRHLGIRGVSRCRKKVFTTCQDPDAARALDLVDRDFTASRPNGLWLTDNTYVPTRSEMA